jgi:flagellar hook protein FlgE
LQNLGNNEFQQTADSGVPQISAPGSTNHGTLTGGALEQSNVDLTNQLVDLITAQRNYQANAQTIKTQQTVDQTLINL